MRSTMKSLYYVCLDIWRKPRALNVLTTSSSHHGAPLIRFCSQMHFSIMASRTLPPCLWVGNFSSLAAHTIIQTSQSHFPQKLGVTPPSFYYKLTFHSLCRFTHIPRASIWRLCMAWCPRPQAGNICDWQTATHLFCQWWALHLQSFPKSWDRDSFYTNGMKRRRIIH